VPVSNLKGKTTLFWGCRVTKMPFVKEEKKKRSLNAIISISSKNPLLPLNVAVFFPSQSKHPV
jgi:hypothetical protein